MNEYPTAATGVGTPGISPESPTKAQTPSTLTDTLIDLVAEALCTQWHNNPDAWHQSAGMHTRWRDMAHTAITTMKEHDA